MNSENRIDRYKEIFNTLCESVGKDNNTRKIDYDTTCIAYVEKVGDLPIIIATKMEEDVDIIILRATPIYEFKEEKVVDLSIAVSDLNYSFNAGCFIYDINSHNLTFRNEINIKDLQIDRKRILKEVNSLMSLTLIFFPYFVLLNEDKMTLNDFVNLNYKEVIIKALQS